MTVRIVQCDDATIPQDWATRFSGNAPIQANRFGPAARVGLRLHDVSDSLPGTLQNRTLDLVTIAAYVYVADQLVSRGAEADIYGKSWRREMAVCLPVSDPDFGTATKCESFWSRP